MVKINGEWLELAGRTLADYLADAGFDSKRVAVEETVLADGDTLEVVGFVGGG